MSVSHPKIEWVIIPCEMNRLPELTNAPCTLIIISKAKQEGNNTDNDFNKEEHRVDDQQCDDAGLPFHRSNNTRILSTDPQRNKNDLTCLSALYEIRVMSELPSMGDGPKRKKDASLFCSPLSFGKFESGSRMPSLPQYVTPLKKDKMKAVHPSGHSGTAEVLNPPHVITRCRHIFRPKKWDT